ncbi:DEAD/DEAH box helicase [Blastochloris sulfoviridis]|uniref:DEAD/DEAH box helicase n=1 Tax=Blastochloris sulfoviridis TaxID=50712 RepID=A0A5M6I455_9HYPH|nr:DEAD/DEAH box helicase [Blastochloris sulfoviridis]KAA5602637.1 DEAD/DEAH box helicase [Blastochloris sulfoviridis]
MAKESRTKSSGGTRPGKAAKRAVPKTSGRARKVLDRPALQGWNTTDDEEIALRRWRGTTEIVAIETIEADHPVFGTFKTRSETGGSYEVEIRDLKGFSNSCGCIDHRVNGLGTCKHVEGVLAALHRRGAKAFRAAAAAGPTRVEIFLDRRGTPRPMIAWPVAESELEDDREPVRGWLAPFLAADGTLDPAPDNIATLVDAWSVAPADVRLRLRVSRLFGPWLAREQRTRSRIEERAAFLAEVTRGEADFEVVKLPLLPYQREGMLHLAFGERALLADEMGLGKTVQAIAACELLARRKGISRVLIVCPASLKAEWEEQIARFTDRPAHSVFGPRAERLARYRDPVFFTIVNYEQVLVDADDINAVLSPDLVVLDEAQRIKNWQTKTARRVKSLRSLYVFVLTGTPVENRIDELYSIVQYLDPELVGPLFRFNRDFYQLDERGRPADYKNLDDLHRRVAPVMLRRRKADVERELPGRTVTNYFVPMVEEQKARYDDYKSQAARLIAIAQRRPLLPKEFDRLQMLLACMRMVCDTPAILDPSCRVSPKLEELERVFGDLFEEPDRKVIVFSEWERMLELVRELAAEMGIETAWHTGSVPQQRRRAEITRFKNDPACRLFLSTDSGSVGLNLQVASAVINVDLPWNPARLEQRIARAWRKNQTRAVTVVNLVCEGSIEHGILHLLGQKQALADGVLDGQGDVSALKMPSGRGAMVERMQAMMEAAEKAAPRIVSPDEAVAEDLKCRHGEAALLIEARQGGDGRVRVLAVLDLNGEALAAEQKRLATGDGTAPKVELVDRATWTAMQRLQASGVLQLVEGPVRVLHRAPSFVETDVSVERKAAEAATLHGKAERAVRMARVLAQGGFPEEAPALLAKAIGDAAAARLVALGELLLGAATASPAQIASLVERGTIPPNTTATLAALWPGTDLVSGAEVARLLDATEAIVAACREPLATLPTPILKII